MISSATWIPHRRAVAAGLAAVLLAACGGGDDDAGPPSSDGAGSGSPFPVQIEHRFGTTTIEEAPERVVTVGLTDQDPLLALGVVPVGTNEWFEGHDGNVMPWATDELEAAEGEVPEVVGDVEGINFEQVAALRPDLILGVYSGLTEEEYGTLSDIAPTVAQPDAYPDWGVPWQEQTRIVGTALGRADEADDLVAGVEAQFAAAREAHPEFAGKVGAIATVWDGSVVVYTQDDVRGQFLDSLGLDQIPGLVEMSEDGFSAEISGERLDLIDVDALVWIVDTIEDDMPRIAEQPVYSGLGLTEEGREVPVENDAPLGAATSFQTVLSLPSLLDGLVPMLAAAVDGDPATEVEQPT
jgi:iron complex transport system substrate-binding protein